MSKIRVLIRDTPTMLRDILEQAIAHQPDMEVIPEPGEREHVPGGQQLSPDVVVVDVSGSDPGDRARALLCRWPGSHALLIAEHGHQMLMFDLQPRRVDMGEMSPNQLLDAIRSVARPHGDEREP